MFRSPAKVVSGHQRDVASFEPGRTARAMINPNARSRDRPGGPNSFGRPRVLAMAITAAT